MSRTSLDLNVGEPCCLPWPVATPQSQLPSPRLSVSALDQGSGTTSWPAPPAPIPICPCPLPMDIHDWLQTTADRQPPPDEDDHPGFPDFLKPQRPPKPAQREQHRKRKRASSEPPSSERHHHRRKYPPTATSSSSSSDHSRQLHPAAASSRSSSSNGSAGWQARDTVRYVAQGKSFERRARHKTRPDRYEAKPKTHGKGRETNEKRKSKSTRRKSHRSTDVARATGMIQSFQLKNGRKDKRLTVRWLTLITPMPIVDTS